MPSSRSRSVFSAETRSEQSRHEDQRKHDKNLIAAGNDRTIRDVWQSVVFGDKTMEVVKEFVYLGSLMPPINDVSLEIQRKIRREDE
jgi:hypothetical protein